MHEFCSQSAFRYYGCGTRSLNFMIAHTFFSFNSAWPTTPNLQIVQNSWAQGRSPCFIISTSNVVARNRIRCNPNRLRIGIPNRLKYERIRGFFAFTWFWTLFCVSSGIFRVFWVVKAGYADRNLGLPISESRVQFYQEWKRSGHRMWCHHNTRICRIL